MVRRRNSAPSPLNLTPATVPLVRNHPKFTLPSPPTSQIHLASHHRTLQRTADPTHLVRASELPRLEIPTGESPFGFVSQRMRMERVAEEDAASEVDDEVPKSGRSTASGSGSGEGSPVSHRSTSSSGSITLTEACGMNGSSSASVRDKDWGWGLKPWSGPNALLPQVATW